MIKEKLKKSYLFKFILSSAKNLNMEMQKKPACSCFGFLSRKRAKKQDKSTSTEFKRCLNYPYNLENGFGIEHKKSQKSSSLSSTQKILAPIGRKTTIVTPMSNFLLTNRLGSTNLISGVSTSIVSDRKSESGWNRPVKRSLTMPNLVIKPKLNHKKQNGYGSEELKSGKNENFISNNEDLRSFVKNKPKNEDFDSFCLEKNGSDEKSFKKISKNIPKTFFDTPLCTSRIESFQESNDLYKMIQNNRKIQKFKEKPSISQSSNINLANSEVFNIQKLLFEQKNEKVLNSPDENSENSSKLVKNEYSIVSPDKTIIEKEIFDAKDPNFQNLKKKLSNIKSCSSIDYLNPAFNFSKFIESRPMKVSSIAEIDSVDDFNDILEIMNNDNKHPDVFVRVAESKFTKNDKIYTKLPVLKPVTPYLLNRKKTVPRTKVIN